MAPRCSPPTKSRAVCTAYFMLVRATWHLSLSVAVANTFAYMVLSRFVNARAIQAWLLKCVVLQPTARRMSAHT